jgi:hypothetical protein
MPLLHNLNGLFVQSRTKSSHHRNVLSASLDRSEPNWAYRLALFQRTYSLDVGGDFGTHAKAARLSINRRGIIEARTYKPTMPAKTHVRCGIVAETRKTLYHYTTQTGLLGIIRDRQIWATHTQYLNDRREFLHAVDLVRGEILRLLDEQNTRPGEASTTRAEALNRMHDAVSLSPEHINVCVCSFSEDSDSLSQWRAYGGSSGFAIGFSPEVLGAAVEKHRFFLAQCIYDPAAQRDVVSALVEEVLDEHLSGNPVFEDAERGVLEDRRKSLNLPL